MAKMDYRYRIAQHESGIGYSVDIERREHDCIGEWLFVSSFHSMAGMDRDIDSIISTIDWLYYDEAGELRNPESIGKVECIGC
jgi:hypothetical protein